MSKFEYQIKTNTSPSRGDGKSQPCSAGPTDPKWPLPVIVLFSMNKNVAAEKYSCKINLHKKCVDASFLHDDRSIKL